MKSITFCLVLSTVAAGAQCIYPTHTPEFVSTSCDVKFNGAYRTGLLFEKRGDAISVSVTPPVDSFALELKGLPTMTLFPGILTRADMELVRTASIKAGLFVVNGTQTARSLSYNESTLILGAVECLLKTQPETPKDMPRVNSDSDHWLGGIIPMTNGKVTYEEVVPVDSVQKDELYRRAQRWLVNNYRSARDVIQYESAADGEIIAKGFFTVTWVVFVLAEEVNVYHTISIRCKDGRFKYTITDAIIRYYADGYKNIPGYSVEVGLEDWLRNPSKQHAQNVYSDIDTRINATVASLKKAMTASSVDNDW